MADPKSKKFSKPEADAEVVQSEPKQSSKVSVVAVRDVFIDLTTNTTIGKEPVEVEMTPWLQAQVDRELLSIV